MGAAESKQVGEKLLAASEDRTTGSILDDEKFIESILKLWESEEDAKKKRAVLDILNLRPKQQVRLWNSKIASTAKIELDKAVKDGIPIWSKTPEAFFRDSSFVPEFSRNFLRALHLCGSRSLDQAVLSRVRLKVLAVAIHRLKDSCCRSDGTWVKLLKQVATSLGSPDQDSPSEESVKKTWSKWAKQGSQYEKMAGALNTGIGVLLVLPEEISDTVWARLPRDFEDPSWKPIVESLEARGIAQATTRECSKAVEAILFYINSMKITWVNTCSVLSSTKELHQETCDDCRTNNTSCDPSHLRVRKRRDTQTTDQIRRGRSKRCRMMGQHVTTDVNLSDESDPAGSTEVTCGPSGTQETAGEKRARPEDGSATDGHQSPPTEPIHPWLLSPAASQQQSLIIHPQPENEWNPINAGQYRGPRQSDEQAYLNPAIWPSPTSGVDVLLEAAQQIEPIERALSNSPHLASDADMPSTYLLDNMTRDFDQFFTWGISEETRTDMGGIL